MCTLAGPYQDQGTESDSQSGLTAQGAQPDSSEIKYILSHGETKCNCADYLINVALSGTLIGTVLFFMFSGTEVRFHLHQTEEGKS